MLARSREWDVVGKSEFLGLWKCLYDWSGKRIQLSVSGVQSTWQQQ